MRQRSVGRNRWAVAGPMGMELRVGGLALGLGPVGAAGPGPEDPMAGEAQELGVLDQASAIGTKIADGDGAHLVEEKLPSDAAEEAECGFQTGHQAQHVLLVERTG